MAYQLWRDALQTESSTFYYFKGKSPETQFRALLEVFQHHAGRAKRIMMREKQALFQRPAKIKNAQLLHRLCNYNAFLIFSQHFFSRLIARPTHDTTKVTQNWGYHDLNSTLFY